MTDPMLQKGIQTLGTWTSWVIVALWVSILSDMGIILINVLDMQGTVDFDAVFLDELSTIAGFFAMGTLLVMIVTMVLVGMWIHRGHANLVEAGYDKQFTPGWAVGWFFIPFANLVMPFRAMRELWNISRGRSDSPNDPPSGDLTAWWGCWLVSNIATNVGVRMEAPGESAGLMIGIVGALLSIAAAWFLRTIILDVAEGQRSLVGIHQTFE